MDEKAIVLDKMVFYSTRTFANMKITFPPPSYNGYGLLIGRNSSGKAVLIVVSPFYVNSFTPAINNNAITVTENSEGGREVSLLKCGSWFEGIFIGFFKSITYF